ncbi:ArsR/SmtB family transcription factor [Streptomyces sp. NPDC101115]|uniref:ArsR/SmtB family transcription factor n=1 Tax=Streptomyces sp. NPDC101115 TaxID=3366106 RepID=UPI0037F69C69
MPENATDRADETEPAHETKPKNEKGKGKGKGKGKETEHAGGTGASGTPTPPGSRVLDPRSLRALAHPLRIQMLRALRHHGPATASRLAERLGESSGATSYHLRQLAAHGFVEDAPELGKGRERWWKASQQGTCFDVSLHKNPDPEVQGAVEVFLHEIANIHTQELNTYLGTRHRFDEVWQDSSDMSDFTLHLSPKRAHELNTKIHDLIEEYRVNADPEGTQTQRIRMHLHAFPQDGVN